MPKRNRKRDSKFGLNPEEFSEEHYEEAPPPLSQYMQNVKAEGGYLPFRGFEDGQSDKECFM